MSESDVSYSNSGGGTDNQQVVTFGFSGTNLVLDLEDGGGPMSVDMSFLLSTPQTLSLSGNTLAISGGNDVDLSGTGAAAMDHFDVFGIII